MPRRPVCLAQPNNQYGRNAFLPYSAGLLQAYARSQPEIEAAYEFSEMLFLREPLLDVVSRWGGWADVVALSTYVWNEQYLLALAAQIKASYPDTLVVMGGPQVPTKVPFNWFMRHPYLDVLVHYEGEETFAEILKARLDPDPDYTKIQGVTVNVDHRVVSTPLRERTRTLDHLPSPYLTGLFDSFFERHPHLDFHATSESHRGCPFSCSFCDWGGLIYTKVAKFSDERVRDEYDWMAARQIELVYNADANFMMLPRDQALADYLIDLKARTGWPKQIRAAWAKVSSERLFGPAKRLHEAGMDKGVTLALQSMHPLTLEAIERANIKFDSFSDLVGKYQAEGMPVYVEFILALPLETYDTFTAGVCKALEAGLDDGLNVYLCMILPNSEMGDPEYQKKYGLQTVRAPLLQQHASPDPNGPIEQAEIVIGTSTMPHDDFVRAYLFAWAVQTFHGMGLLRETCHWWIEEGARGCHSAAAYRSFYTQLLEWADQPSTVFRAAYDQTLHQFLRGIAGKGWDRSDPRYGPITWPLEEIAFLDIVSGDLDRFYQEVGERFHVPPEVLRADREGLRTPAEFDGDLEEYAQRVVWYGRKGGKFRKDPPRHAKVA